VPTLRLYGGGPGYCIPNYSIVDNLLFDLVAQTPNRELLPCEKLFFVDAIGRGAHPGYYADVLMECGCFAEARRHYAGHPRKLGDICWCEGNLDQAEEFYGRTEHQGQGYLNSPDYDRLIKLAFFRERWEQVIERFCEADFTLGAMPGHVCIGHSDTSASSFIEMLACALNRLACATPPGAEAKLKSAFVITPEAWAEFLAGRNHGGQKNIERLKKRCRPRVGAVEVCTFAEAVRRGDTPRARHVADYVGAADRLLETAQNDLEEFGKTGNEDSLERFIRAVTGSGSTSMSRSFLFSALGHDSFARADVPAERLIRLFSSHPIMDRRHLGTLLDLRFKTGQPITANDILTGMFQRFGRALPEKRAEVVGLNDITELAACREWARVRLEQWLLERASARAEEVAAVWRERRAQPAPHPFNPHVVCQPSSPRNMREWDELISVALTWLRARWSREIGSSRWVSENQLYQLLRQRLKGMEVIQHGRPIWLEPQHLDVWIPEVGVAVEYMGRQHFEPLEFFGGEAAFRELAARDQKKAELCRENAIELLHVRFDDDLATRSREIVDRVFAIAGHFNVR
jgi:hypothetical protein